MRLKFFKHIWRATIGTLLWHVYAPKSIENSATLKHVDSHHYEIEGIPYKIVQASKSTIFTNRIDNISFIVNHQLIPVVSWQYNHGKTVDDSSNKLLTGEIQPQFPPKKIKGTVVSLLSGGGGNYNYYHWLYDVLPRLHLCEPFLQNPSAVRFLIPENSLRFQKETLKYLGIHPGQQLSSKKFRHITCDSSVITSHPNPDQNRVPLWITEFLRKKFLPLKSTSFEGAPFIYISRDDQTNRRQLANEAELLKILEDFGFQTVKLSELRFKEQVSLFAHAKIIIGVHGAGFANLSFCNNQASVIELFSSSYQPKMYRSISENVNLDYHSFSFSYSYQQRKQDQTDPQTGTIFLKRKELEKIRETLQKLV